MNKIKQIIVNSKSVHQKLKSVCLLHYKIISGVEGILFLIQTFRRHMYMPLLIFMHDEYVTILTQKEAIGAATASGG